MIPYGRQDVTEADIEAVKEVLHSDFLTQGPAVPRFERCVADYVGASHAVAVNSATSALHIACLALDLGPGDWLWTSPNTFVATANAALYCGANVDFVDIDPETYNLSISALEQKLELAEKTDRLPKIVIPVHFAGSSCDMEALHKLAIRYGFRVIEDASHAIGGHYQQQKVGNCRYSDITIFSFHPVKIITSAEGGMAVTNDGKLARRMDMLRSHGITRALEEMQGTADGAWYYQQIALGFNYRLTDIQAALGFSQMQRIDDYIHRRHVAAERYNKMLHSLHLVLPYQAPDSYSAYHLYVIRASKDRCGVSRADIFTRLRAAGVGVNVHYIPVHLQPYYKKFGFKLGDFPNAEAYYSEAISLPLFPTMTETQQDFVVETISEILHQ